VSHGDGWRWPFGKHKGKTLGNTPLGYVHWALCHCARLDDHERELLRRELIRRGDWYVMAWEVLGDLEERLTARVATDPALDHATSATVNDHVLLACEETREHFGIGDGARLIVPRRVAADMGPSDN
jgi:hypothetical protein